MRKNIIISILIIVISILIVILLPRLHIVQGCSMEPTIHDGQLVLSVIPSRIECGDLIIIKTEYGLFLKRVIGVPGDTVQIRDGRAYLNGEIADELETDYAGIAITPIFLADCDYFVLGDNRDNSLDSRYPDIGVINKRQILRKAIYIIFFDFSFLIVNFILCTVKNTFK